MCGKYYVYILTLIHVVTVAVVIAAYSLPEILEKLLSHEEAEFVYTIKFNQDPVEIFLDNKELVVVATTTLQLLNFYRIPKH